MMFRSTPVCILVGVLFCSGVFEMVLPLLLLYSQSCVFLVFLLATCLFYIHSFDKSTTLQFMMLLARDW